jgi:hypothetical protein
MASRYANDWVEAKITEQISFKEHGVYDLVPRSTAGGKKIFRGRLVMKKKMVPPSLQHPHGSIEKFRYRMTIAAFTKMLTQGVDYAEKYASTVRWTSIKTLLAIAVRQEYDIVLFDIATFFLYGTLSHAVFMEQPDGWVTPDKPKEDWIWRVTKSMYGHPAAAHCSQAELKAVFTAQDQFRPTVSDDCIYVSQGEQANYAALGTHIDDVPCIGTPSGIDAVRTCLSSKFKITEKVNPAVIVGVQVERNRSRRWLKLHQQARTETLLAKHNMTDCKGADTPMDPGTAKALMLLPTDVPDPAACKKYQSLVGEFIWLMDKTRPDLHVCVCLLARFLKNATQKHLDLALGRPLRFLRRTSSYGVVFSPGDGEWILSGASDSDLAGDLFSARSTLGHCLRMGEFGSIVTRCGLDKKISTATGQAETYAMLSLVKDTVWLRTLLSELGFPMEAPTPLRSDNDGVVKQSTKAINHTTAKHYRIAQAYIRQHVLDSIVVVKGEDTHFNESDIFTKALGREAFQRHQASIMGPQSPP